MTKTIGQEIERQVEVYKKLYLGLCKDKSEVIRLKSKGLAMHDLVMKKYVAEKVYEEMMLFIDKKEAENASSYSKKIMQWRNSKNKWIDSIGDEKFKDWDDLQYRGWEFVQTTDECSVIMKKKGIFQEWRVKNE